MLWLRDYFTDAEIEEYKDTIFKKYFKKESRGQGKRSQLSREGTRRRNSAIKTGAKTKRQGNGKA